MVLDAYPQALSERLLPDVSPGVQRDMGTHRKGAVNLDAGVCVREICCNESKTLVLFVFLIKIRSL